ncbi:DUF2785 domain-containing protein [Paenibacillus agri]|uniref:DUF2785 domain-containing protein n=1 Tax=Paenibacillus agri TaxID=2744309 RepID=A0A850EUP9_9BACL|nr:DUF2785 domain-containing protein [Paenibacillus agri]NUU61651.1 DUF2785 domain-containing protein [Paenibacillus agri]
MNLKLELKTIMENDYRVSEHYNYMLISELMLENIGSADSELRDTLIYSTFSRWILQNTFTPVQLRTLLYSAWDERHMFYKIGETETDSVFTRSFSVLLLPLILTANRISSFLTTTEIKTIQEKLVQFLNDEKDYRGYVAGKGWAHAVAHAADAIEEISQQVLSTDDMIALLVSIRNVVCTKATVFTNMEEERLTSAVVTLLEHQELEGAVFEEWLTGFLQWDRTKELQEEYKIIFNVKNFFAALYFRLEGRSSPIFAEAVRRVRQELMKPYV